MRHLPLPSIEYDQTLSHILCEPGPDEIMKLARDASESVREWLAQYAINQRLLAQLRFESLILPFMFEARRIGERRGEKMAASQIAGLYPLYTPAQANDPEVGES